MLSNLFNPGSTGGVGGAMFGGNSPSAAGSDADSPLGPAMGGAIESQL